MLAGAGYDGFLRSHQRFIMGHEFVGTVAGYGPKAKGNLEQGTPVVALPLVRNDRDMHAIGLSASARGLRQPGRSRGVADVRTPRGPLD